MHTYEWVLTNTCSLRVGIDVWVGKRDENVCFFV